MSKDFKRPESWKYKRLNDKWRKPRGAKNPAKRGKAGRPALPKAGYRTPRAIRGKHPTGLTEVLVERPQDLETLDANKVIIRIGGTVGARKRLAIFEKAKAMGLRVIQNENAKKTGK